MKNRRIALTVKLARLALPLVLVAAGCGQAPEPPDAAEGGTAGLETETASGSDMRDVHSYARPDEVTVEHLDLDLDVDFDRQVLSGRASLRITNPGGHDRLHLDTRDLEIEAVTLDDGEETSFELGDVDLDLGRELVVAIRPDTEVVHVDYATSPEAAAVQWLAPEQTAGGEHPFLFTQSQAILARTWVPIQDTPGVRFTYDATVRVPSELLAVMSAENPTERNADGVYEFTMPQPIPSYLLALAVGDLAFRSLGPKSGVYAEPSVVERAADEFADTEEMMAAAERLYGPYRWGRYDILVLPPSFPFGGMENPRLTFATPTILAGDRSLVALIAHELAHSWSGNLVTNATWNDFWLNEGFTVYLERRIMEELYGKEHADMLALLGRQDLEQEIEELGPESPDTHLHLALAGRNPDDGMTDVAYEKGYFLLRRLEEAVGRERFDAFLRAYFDRHAFESLTTDEFVAELERELLAEEPGLLGDAREWIYGPGLPASAPAVTSQAFARVDAEVEAWRTGEKPASKLDVEGYTTQHWLHFLRALPDEMSDEQMAELDAAFGFTRSGNSEVLNAWFQHAIRNEYRPAYPALRAFLTNMGRRKFLQPLYQELAETDEGLRLAREIYAQARPGYHSVSRRTLDEILAWEEKG